VNSSDRRCVVLQHLPAEGPYAIATALGGAGVPADVLHLYDGAAVPGDAATLAGLVVMGGSMAAYSDEDFPTRRAELQLLEAALEEGVPVLGVCLGAQLLVQAAGGRVYKGGAGPEIGWGPVRFLPEAADDELLGDVPGSATVLHWHGDTFDAPRGAALLASSDRYPNQAVRIGEAAWGLQFHLEVDDAAVAAFLEDFGDDALTAGVSPSDIGDAADDMLAALAPLQKSVLGRFARLVVARSRSLVD